MFNNYSQKGTSILIFDGYENGNKEILFCFPDWVFNIPDLYKGCDDRVDDCQSNPDTPLVHAFNHLVNATNTIEVKCVEKKRPDGLPGSII